MIKRVFISAVADLHGNLPEMQYASLVVICGDIFPGELDNDPDGQGAWFRTAFLPWVDKIECRRAVLVAGNHDHDLLLGTQEQGEDLFTDTDRSASDYTAVFGLV